MHCKVLGGCFHCASTCQCVEIFISSSTCVNRWRSGASHCTGVSGTAAPPLEPESMTWRKSSRSVLSSDITRSLLSCCGACSTSAMERTRLPPSPSCRSWASCTRSCSLALCKSLACCRSRNCASSARAWATCAVSSSLKCSMRRMYWATRQPSSTARTSIFKGQMKYDQVRSLSQRRSATSISCTATTTIAAQAAPSRRF